MIEKYIPTSVSQNKILSGLVGMVTLPLIFLAGSYSVWHLLAAIFFLPWCFVRNGKVAYFNCVQAVWGIERRGWSNPYPFMFYWGELSAALPVYFTVLVPGGATSTTSATVFAILFSMMVFFLLRATFGKKGVLEPTTSTDVRNSIPQWLTSPGIHRTVYSR